MEVKACRDADQRHEKRGARNSVSGEKTRQETEDERPETMDAMSDAGHETSLTSAFSWKASSGYHLSDSMYERQMCLFSISSLKNQRLVILDQRTRTA